MHRSTMTTENGNRSATFASPPMTSLSMGLNTYKVSVDDMFGANRAKVISKLQQKNIGKGSIIFLKGGAALNRFDTDHEPLFRQESYFIYLFGVKEPDCAGSIDVDTGFTTLFIPRLPKEYATWMGPIKTPQHWKETYNVDNVQYVDDVEMMLEKQMTPTENISGKLLLMKGTNSDSGNTYEPPIFKSTTLNSLADTYSLFDVVAESRVHKSNAELRLLQHVTELTSFAHVYTMRNTSPGMMEYQSESLFRHYCFYNYGCRNLGYTPICGCGPNGAILHYGHAGEPNARLISDGDFCLFDMGAEYFGYGSDITCSFPANGTYTARQAAVYNGVLDAQRAVYKILKPGVVWVDCHKAAEGEIIRMLIKLGLVVPQDKSVEELVEMRLGAVFMPCGMGHFIGIDTHDVGGYLTGQPERVMQPGLKSLRTARVIEPAMVLTVEPGCYFIEHLLNEALEDSSPFVAHLNAELVNEFRDFGGIRLEDVVAITDTGFVNYTLCPRTVSEVEYVMAGGKWPPMKDEAPELCRDRLTDPNPLPPPPSC